MPLFQPASHQHRTPSRERRASNLASPWLAVITLLAGAALMPTSALAQTESYMLGPGSNIGPATKIKPTNCKQAGDGTVTCDTEVVNPPGNTPAKPLYNPFNN